MCENGNIRWNQIHRQTMILITCKYNILAVLWYVWILSVCMRSQWEQANKHCLRTKIALYISQRCINCRIWSYCLAILCFYACFFVFTISTCVLLVVIALPVGTLFSLRFTGCIGFGFGVESVCVRILNICWLYKNHTRSPLRMIWRICHDYTVYTWRRGKST